MPELEAEFVPKAKLLLSLPMESVTSGKYKCAKCGYVYDPEKGDQKHGIEPGTKFEELPEDWKCPRCRKGKDMFRTV